MRTNNSNFNSKNLSQSKSIRLVIEIDFSENGTDLYYFTSHSDVPTVSPVVHATLKNTSSISQKLIPERANSSIGSIKFDLVDVGGAVTAVFNSKRASRKVLFGKRVRLYLGYESMAWADYRIEQTQYIDKKLTYKNGVYKIPCRDAQDRLNKPIFEPLKTRLSAALTATDTNVQVYDTTDWALVARDANHSDAPNASVTYLEISDGTNKEWCRVTAIASASFTVVRGVLGTTAIAWSIPSDASDEKGPQVTELIFIEMDSLKLSYAVMTGVLLNQSSATLPSHWHLGMDASLFDSTQFSNGFIAYAAGLKKTDGKKFIESEIMLPNSRYLKILGDGSLKLDRIYAIQGSANSIAVIDQTKIVKYNDLTFDSSSTTNKFEIEWSYDSLPKKPQYRRKSTFVFADSVTDYGEKVKSVKFRIVNGIRATTSTLLNIVNAFADRFAGEAARLKVSVLPSLNDLEVGDVVSVQHPSIRDFNSGATINRSMQIISTRVDQKKGTVDLELFGSTFAPAPLTDGSVRVLNDSFYTADGSALSNVTSNSLTIDTTLTGSADHNSSVFYHAADLTIPAGVTLTVKDNAQLRVMGHLTILGSINCVGNGKATAGYIGTSVGDDGPNTELNDGDLFNLAPTPGAVINGEFEAFPTLDLDNPDGNSISGMPTDLRGTGGATGGQGSYTDEFGAIVTAAGGTGNDGGSALVIVSRGMSLSGSGAIDMSGVAGNAGATTSGIGGSATGGIGGHSTPGGILVLLDGGTSSAPDLSGRVTAIGNKSIDIKANAARVQFIPQPRTPLVDEPIQDQVTGNVAFKQANPPTDSDCQAKFGRNLIENDVWYETDNNNFRYFYNGTTWDYLQYIQPWSGMLDDNGKLPSDNATVGATWGGDIMGQPSDSVLRKNLLSIEEWADGKSSWTGTDFAPYSTSATNASNVITQTDGPKGSRVLAWKATTIINQDPSGSWSGGWQHTIGASRFDNTKSYRFTCWVRLSSVSYNFYMGFGNSDVSILGPGEAAALNPYSFSNNLPPTPGKWYLLVSIINGSGYSGTIETGLSGWYDPDTGLIAKNATREYKNLTISTTLFFRISSYRAALNTVSEFADPRVDELDGNEPSIIDILSTATVGATWGGNIIGQPADSVIKDNISLSLNYDGSAAANNKIWISGTSDDGTAATSTDATFNFNGANTTAFKNVYAPPASTAGEFYILAPLPLSALPPGTVQKTSPGPSSGQLRIEGGLNIWNGVGSPSGSVGDDNEQFVAIAKYVTDGTMITSASIITPASVAELADFRATSNNQHIVTAAPASSLGTDGDFAHVQPGGAGTAITSIYLKSGGQWQQHEQNTFSAALNANGGLKQGGSTILNGSDTWLRTTGPTGWYSTTYGGGVYMTDSTYVTVYASKRFKVNSTSDLALYAPNGGVTANSFTAIGGKKYGRLFVQTTQPASMVDGDIWMKY